MMKTYFWLAVHFFSSFWMIQNIEICDFSRESLDVALTNDKSVIGNSSNEENHSDNNIKHCVKFTKGFEIFTFICPKGNNNDNYNGIEIRPVQCFEKVRINGKEENLKDVLKGVITENKETDTSIIRKAFIPPTIYNDMSFECSCDNSLTIKDNTIGARGIMRVHLKKNKIFGCDFNYDASETKFSNGKSAFTNFYDNQAIDLNKSTVCNTEVNTKEVYLGLVCPEGYEMYPENCFEYVLFESNVVRINELIKHDVKLHIEKNKHTHMSFASFTLNPNENPKSFSCQCIKKNANSFPLIANIMFSNYESYSFNYHVTYLILISIILISYI
ncbi:6-cysteine protein [Plasmodium chabaudi adami]|uniref:6-cysteine protein n=1 Tax=Plasmodium chabaudi adami TaxID=5826 RepID=A0A1C6Y798_PLACE|nr:6-cysteine protein [Plasmodium chabaudi adami]